MLKDVMCDWKQIWETEHFVGPENYDRAALERRKREAGLFSHMIGLSPFIPAPRTPWKQKGGKCYCVTGNIPLLWESQMGNLIIFLFLRRKHDLPPKELPRFWKSKLIGARKFSDQSNIHHIKSRKQSGSVTVMMLSNLNSHGFVTVIYLIQISRHLKTGMSPMELKNAYV